MKAKVKVINKLARECARRNKCQECSSFQQTAPTVGACGKYSRYIEFGQILPGKEVR